MNHYTYPCEITGRICYSYDQYVRRDIIKYAVCVGCSSNREKVREQFAKDERERIKLRSVWKEKFPLLNRPEDFPVRTPDRDYPDEKPKSVAPERKRRKIQTK